MPNLTSKQIYFLRLIPFDKFKFLNTKNRRGKKRKMDEEKDNSTSFTTEEERMKTSKSQQNVSGSQGGDQVGNFKELWV